jgi:hypothetical protein
MRRGRTGSVQSHPRGPVASLAVVYGELADGYVREQGEAEMGEAVDST